MPRGVRENDWSVVQTRGAEIVESYETGVTLRQLYYRLLSEGLANTKTFYTDLAARSAMWRRAGTFPELVDGTRGIERYASWTSPAAALIDLRAQYRRDRTEGQKWSIYLGTEARGLVKQLSSWFGDPLGIPILALGGQSSRPFQVDALEDIDRQDRPSVLLYAGDLDSSGEKIEEVFTRHVAFDRVERVALTDAQMNAFNLTKLPGMAKDVNAKAFIARHGSLYRVEVDALEPTVFRSLFQEAIDRYWNADAYAIAMSAESADREELS